MKIRGLNTDFLNAMREGLERGRNKGQRGWDERWDDTMFCGIPSGPHGTLMLHLYDELIELAIALTKNDPAQIRCEAADVANMAMMVADYHEALKP